MKSKLMAVMRLPERFVSDLKIYEDIPSEQCDAITDLYIEFESAGRPLKDQEIAQRVTSLGTTGTQFYNILATLSFARNYLDMYRDEPENFVDDLVESKNLSKNAADKYLRSLNKLKEANLLSRDIGGHFRGILPVFRGAYTRCLVLTRFATDDDTSLKESEPVVNELEPFVLLNFEVDGPDTSQELSILVNEKELVEIIEKLTESKKRLASLKKALDGIV